MNWERFLSEIVYSAATGSGAGGQHVNRRQTKVTACWYPGRSQAMEGAEKAWLLRRLSKKISDSGGLCISSHRFRSQLKNKKDCTRRLRALVEQALVRPRVRKQTKMPDAVRAKIRQTKARRSQIKQWRKKIPTPIPGDE